MSTDPHAVALDWQQTLREAGGLLAAVLTLAVPVSVAVGALLVWLRLDDVELNAVPFLAAIGPQQLGLEGARVLLPAVATAGVAFVVVLGFRVVDALLGRGMAPAPVIVFGFLLVVAAAAVNERDEPILIASLEAPPSALAAVGGAFALAGVLLLLPQTLGSWPAFAAAALAYITVATLGLVAYAEAFDRGIVNRSAMPDVTVLLTVPKPDATGAERPARKLLDGQLLTETANAVVLCLDCEGAAGRPRLLRLARDRVVWVRAPARED